MLLEKTLCIIKPDAVKRDLIGAITQMIESEDFKIYGLKMLQLTAEQARIFYAVHNEKHFFQELVDFIISGPVVILVLVREDAVKAFRNLIGHTDPKQADKDTIRGRYGISIDANTVHGSDSVDNANQEIAFFFKPSEILF